MQKLQEILNEMKNCVKVDGNSVSVVDKDYLQKEGIDKLILKAVFGDEEEKAVSRWLIWQIAQSMDIRPASINNVYMKRATGEVPVNFTVPAMNLRALSYDSARSAFKVMKELDAGAVIFEIARSEMTYTDQSPTEYVSSILAAAIKEDWKGPVFIQGDHFQVKRAKFFSDAREEELQALRDLIKESIKAGFYNIDVDTSTLVELGKGSLEEEQHYNSLMTAEFTKYIRGLEPEGVTVSVGGEIGEIGDKNSTPEDLHAYMKVLNQHLGDSVIGISKVSVQTGTVHGGVVGPDGKVQKVKVDFETLRNLSEIARKDYGMGGAVQHGASTLPDEMFDKFPETTATEIHLATGFQNIIYDIIPEDLREETYNWLLENKKDQFKEGMTKEQFFYKNRKYAVGPFKMKFWSLSEDIKGKIREALYNKFKYLFEKLGVKNTRSIVEKYAQYPRIEKKIEDYLTTKAKAEDVEGLAD